MTKFTPQLKSSKCNLNIPRLETLSMLRVICLFVFCGCLQNMGEHLKWFFKTSFENKYKPNLNSFSYFLISTYCEAAKTLLSITKKPQHPVHATVQMCSRFDCFFAQNIELLRIGHWWLKHFLLLFYFF